MKITSRTEYGLRAMVYLAGHPEDEPAPLGDIAASEGIPAAFLERILARMRDEGLVRTTRGASGGYALARQPHDVSVVDIVIALEGPLALVDCLQTDRSCVRAEGCPSRVVWRRLDEAITEALAGISLADLVAEVPLEVHDAASPRARAEGERRGGALRSTGA